MGLGGRRCGGRVCSSGDGGAMVVGWRDGGVVG